MPDFGHSFSGLKSDRLLTHAELVRAVRFMVASEYEATQLYEQLAESTDNVLAQKVLRDVANEERVHAGEFLRLLQELQPDEADFYRQGAEEVEEEFLGGISAEDAAGAAGLGIGSLQSQDPGEKK